MALPTAADVAAYLRLTTAAATADASFIARALAEATALVERRLGVPIVATERTMTVEAAPASVPANYYWGSGYADGYYTVAALFLPLYPVAASPAPVIVDPDGVTIAAEDYTIERDTGRVLRSSLFDTFVWGRYTITATVGMSAAPDYATAVEPVLSGVILDIVADRYQNREPGYSTVTAAGGVSRTHRGGAMPPRAEEALALFRRVRV